MGVFGYKGGEGWGLWLWCDN